MKLGLYSLYWDNIDLAIPAAQRRVCDHLKLPLQQHRINGLDHGEWIDWVLEREKNDVSVFLDIDCIPLSRAVFLQNARWTDQFQGLCGAKACANHLDKTRAYAGPWYLFVSLERWRILDRCSACVDHGYDVAQNLTEAWLFYRGALTLIWPTMCEIPLWDLPDKKQAYGIGTTYGEHCYHLFEARSGEHTELFLKACERVITGGRV